MEGWRRRLIDASALVALLGLVYVVGGVTLWVTELAPESETAHRALYQLVVQVLFGGVILALGVHVERSELRPEERFSVLVWCYGGFTPMFLLSAWGHLGAIIEGAYTVAFVSDFVVFTSLGGAFGVIVGLNRGRATKNRLLAERNEDQRETLALLTRLVSHDIRNDMAIGKGYAEIVAEHVAEEDDYAVEVIQTRVENTIELLEDASTLVKTLDEDREFEPIDLSRVLRKEVRSLQESHPTVEVATDVEPAITVRADRLLQQVFSNLLGNAVAHNDADDLSITVRAWRDGSWATVEIDDDGRGISPEDRERLFELGEEGADSDGDGIGLYLVSRLAEIYGGDGDVEESPAVGARFRVRLPVKTD
jgi:signal transduction histidine kinase